MANALESLIDAGRLLTGTDIRLVIVGRGPDEDRLRGRASGLANVVFAGSVAKADVPATLRLFDACYVGFHRSPLYRFGIAPNKVYDYMAAGRPVILAAEAGNDVVRDADCGVTVPPDDPVALAEAIQSLRARPTAELTRLGANGRAYVAREHGYRVLARRYRAVLEGSSE
jgi:glycosyltransferase involved in cell wall biosynthesis